MLMCDTKSEKGKLSGPASILTTYTHTQSHGYRHRYTTRLTHHPALHQMWRYISMLLHFKASTIFRKTLSRMTASTRALYTRHR